MMVKNKYCSIFYCDRMRERVCCASCENRSRCRRPCLNDPDRCGLEEKKETKHVNQNRKCFY